ncbi:hypothetical protein LZ30DRAFT_611597 [Colletotrichum cereale]|nr:hypothetical protein LZ30DRAFT_611597 [Colletotrichum cereale]
MHPGNIAIAGHLFFESIASMSFFLQPQKQLQDPAASEEAVLICHSYAGMLLATNVLCLLSIIRSGSDKFDDTSAMVTWSMSIYHLFPIRRAWTRIKKRRDNYLAEEQIAGGPPGHLIIHSVLFLSLVLAGWCGRV